MNKFSIEFLLNVSKKQMEKDSCYGSIQIGSFQENFLSSLSFWSMQDYEIHWKKALQRIVSGYKSSCLITSMYDPTRANFIEWWPICRVENLLYFQDGILLLDSIKIPFDISDPFQYVPEREIYTEQGEKISEWIVTVEDVENFLCDLNAR
ncbi:hypothetical protein [Microcoleus sp. B4-C1]|uniref:hypothetical protein n=1 Tax=Microcoleus sp. B4-C1 TaxID=2818660 RepID=UPI002FD68B3B